jgi:hypothetical protein
MISIGYTSQRLSFLMSLKVNFIIQIEKCQGKQTNINTWSNSRSEVKTNEMPDAVK